jgi:hypothetical protein
MECGKCRLYYLSMMPRNQSRSYHAHSHAGHYRAGRIGGVPVMFRADPGPGSPWQSGEGGEPPKMKQHRSTFFQESFVPGDRSASSDVGEQRYRKPV